VVAAASSVELQYFSRRAAQVGLGRHSEIAMQEKVDASKSFRRRSVGCSSIVGLLSSKFQYIMLSSAAGHRAGAERAGRCPGKIETGSRSCATGHRNAQAGDETPHRALVDGVGLAMIAKLPQNRNPSPLRNPIFAAAQRQNVALGLGFFTPGIARKGAR
jgi:hypothetical protein